VITVKLGKRTLAVGALLIAFAAVMATQYATVRAQASIVITGKYPWIQFMAHDIDARDGGWLLRRNSDTVNYTIYIGNLTGGQIKIWTAAFAIVNTEKNYTLRITGVRLWGSGLGKLLNYINVTLHSKPDAVGVPPAKTNAYQPPSESYWTTDSDAMLYWNGSQGAVDHSTDGWVLGQGNGYDKNNGILYYSYTNSTGALQWAKAQYDTTNHVYNYTTYVYSDESGSHDNDAVSGTDNFVWVQIVIDLSQISDVSTLGVTLDSPLTINMEFFFEGTAVT